MVLEIGSGTGQHAAYFAEQLPGLVFQPSDTDPENLENVRARVDQAKLTNLRLPFRLDVRSPTWGVDRVDVIYSANMLHIAPWECAEALFAGAGRHLADPGLCVVYGPFRVGGVHTAPSNAAFDADLRARDASYGVRDLEAIAALAERAGLSLAERVEMPANNLTLVFARAARA